MHEDIGPDFHDNPDTGHDYQAGDDMPGTDPEDDLLLVPGAGDQVVDDEPADDDSENVGYVPSYDPPAERAAQDDIYGPAEPHAPKTVDVGFRTLSGVQMYFGMGPLVLADRPMGRTFMKTTAEAVDLVREYEVTLPEYVAAQPNKNDEFATELQDVDKKIVSDYGIGNALGPMVVLDTPAYYMASLLPGMRNVDQEPSFNAYEHTIVNGNPEDIDLYGPDFIFRAALRARVTGVGEQRLLIGGVHDQGGSRLRSWMPAFRPNEIVITHTTGYVHFNPNAPRGIGGAFWEEGFNELYSVEGAYDSGRTWEMSGIVPVYRDGEALMAYVGRNASARVVQGGVVNLPASFAPGIATLPDGSARTIHNPGLLPAYGIHLLDTAAPGVFDDMKQGRINADAKQSFVDRVNAVQPGLYQELSQLPPTQRGFRKGLLRIIDILGIRDRPVAG